MKYSVKFKKIIKRVFVGVFVIVLLVCLPNINLLKDENLDLIYEKFVGVKSEYQGMIEIWNIDTFESGLVSKNKMLTRIADGFKKQNKGIYFLIRNISESECKNLLESGQVPDLFSCSYGVAEMLKDRVSAFDEKFEICDNLLKAGQDDVGRQLAVAWCANVYCLMTAGERVEKAGQDASKGLKEIAFNCGYKTTSKKGEKIVWSLEFGCGKYLLPQKALLAYYNNEGVPVVDTSINKSNIKQTSYSAYCSFIAGKSSVLLGTLRDVYRLKNREENGKIDGVVVEPLTKFSDLVQFMFKVDDGNLVKQKYVDGFVKYLVSKETQSVVCEGGMVSVLKGDEMGQKVGVMKDIPLQNIESYEVFNVFLSKFEIEKFQQDFV